MTAAHILYLDYDGIFHPADVRVTSEEPSRPQTYVRGRPTELPLFEHMGMLEHLLAPFPSVQIVLATSWLCMLGYRFAVERRTPRLRELLIGATWHPNVKEVPPTRF